MSAAPSPEFSAVLFAGGVGQRLWPLSRRNTPKQFAALLEQKSSIQLAMERLRRIVPADRIFVGTNRAYADILREQLPEIPAKNFFLEPVRKDVAAAVALAFFALEREGVQGPVIFQWSDHYVQHSERLIASFQTAGRLLADDERRIVLIAEEPKFPNDNLGWIELGEERGTSDGVPYFGFGRWRYRPPPAECQSMFESGSWVWNTGHFVSSVAFMTETFAALPGEARALARGVRKIVEYRGTPEETAKLEELYPKLPTVNFDNAFLCDVPRERALLLKADLGWQDPGNLYSLKQALQAGPEHSVLRGNVIDLRSRDSLVINETERPLVTMGLSGVIVVELPDVTLVIDKSAVRDLSDLLRELERRGLEPLL